MRTTNLKLTALAAVLVLAGFGCAGAKKADKTAEVKETKLISTSEVARHATAEDCWVIVSGKVYDVTGLVEKHAFVREQFVGHCGKDATVAFATREKAPPMPHPEAAFAKLQETLLGDLVVDDAAQ